MSIRKIIRIIFVVVIIFIVAILYFFFRKIILNESIDSNKIVIYNNFKQEYESNKYYFEEIIKNVVKKEKDWELLPLTSHFKNKFKYNIFDIELDNRFIVDYVDIFPYKSDKDKCIMYLETWEKLDKIWQRKIHYVYNENYMLDDMELLDTRLIKDTDGYFPRYDIIYKYGNSDYENKMILRFLFMPFVKGHYDKFETTKHFNEKFPEVDKKMPIKIDRPYLYIRNKTVNGNKFVIWIYDNNCHYEYEIDILTDENGAIDDMLYRYIKTYEGDTDNLENYQNMIENDVYKSNEW